MDRFGLQLGDDISGICKHLPVAASSACDEVEVDLCAIR